MPHDLQILVFRFSGRADVLSPSRHGSSNAPAAGSPPHKGDEAAEAAAAAAAAAAKAAAKLASELAEQSKKQTFEAIKKLNRDADEIAEEIQDEIRKQFPFTGVLAEISFNKGSVVLLGTVTMTALNWAGGVALDAVRNELAEIIKVSIKRVITRVWSGLSVTLEPAQIQVEPDTLASSRPPEQTRTQESVTPNSPSVPLATEQHLLRGTGIAALLVITSVILLIQLLSLAGQYLTVSVKP